MSIFTIIWFILLFIFDVFVIFWFFRKKILLDKVEETKIIIPTLGHTIAMNGIKGKGKTTTCSGIVQVLTEYLYAEMDARMNDIRLSLPDIDFNLLETYFDQKYPLFVNVQYGESLTIDYILLTIDDHKLNTFYTDFLGLRDKRSMIIDYLLNYWVKNYRGVETYSSGFIFNFVSGKLSKRLDPTSSQLRNVRFNENYQGGFYTIKFNDEKSIQAGNEKSNDKDLRNSGVRDYLALKRHEGKATCFDISPSQIATDVNAQERRQNDINIDIFDRCDSLADFKLTRKILHVILKIAYIPIGIWLFFKAIFKRLSFNELQDEFSKKPGIYRNFEAFIDKLCKLLKRQGYIRIRCKAYYKADDVGKRNEDLYDKYIFYFPIYYCYGPIDTYEYYPVMKEFSKMNSKAINEKISQFDDKAKFALFLKTIDQ